LLQLQPVSLLFCLCTQLVDGSSRSAVLLVSTASATVDRHRTGAEADAARHDPRLGVVVLGVGSTVNGSEATLIASQRDHGVVYADSFDQLLDPRLQFANLLTDKICRTSANQSRERKCAENYNK